MWTARRREFQTEAKADAKTCWVRTLLEGSEEASEAGVEMWSELEMGWSREG